MDYKEKYEMALDRARKYKKKGYMMINCALDNIFPELNESEDERIRKDIKQHFLYLDDSFPDKAKWLTWLEKQGNTNEAINMDKFAQDVLRGAAISFISWIDYNAAEGNMCLSNMECKDIVDSLVSGDWNKIYAYMKKKLEKQGEDELESKFHEGDWIVDKSGFVQQVLDFRGGIYTCTYNSFTTDCESNYHLWTIEDAKDSDVLAVTMYPEGTWIGILKEYNGCTFSSYCFVNTKGTFKLGTYNHGNGKAIHPATKEQRDLLFQKMKEAGYEWDKEKKELKKIEQNIEDTIDIEDKICYSVPNPYFLSDKFVYAHHKELGTVYIKLNCAEEIEEIGVNIVKRMHNTPLDKIKELHGWRKANEMEQSLIEHIGEEYWQRINKMNLI